ncbi:MAG: hypothetical protein NC313_03410 [Butyrivibrio sp.]|nr:hypothetical protein [Butyrivibrio sp.]
MDNELLKSDKKQSPKWKEYLRMTVTGAIMGMSACVWWFFLYPELCFPDDTYEIVYETKEGSGEEDIYDMLMYSDEEQIVIKSRILEWLKSRGK